MAYPVSKLYGPESEAGGQPDHQAYPPQSAVRLDTGSGFSAGRQLQLIFLCRSLTGAQTFSRLAGTVHTCPRTPCRKPCGSRQPFVVKTDTYEFQTFSRKTWAAFASARRVGIPTTIPRLRSRQAPAAHPWLHWSPGHDLAMHRTTTLACGSHVRAPRWCPARDRHHPFHALHTVTRVTFGAIPTASRMFCRAGCWIGAQRKPTRLGVGGGSYSRATSCRSLVQSRFDCLAEGCRYLNQLHHFAGYSYALQEEIRCNCHSSGIGIGDQRSLSGGCADIDHVDRIDSNDQYIDNPEGSESTGVG